MQPASIQPATLLARASDLPTALEQLYASLAGPAQVILGSPAHLYHALMQAGPLVADQALLDYTPLGQAAASLQVVNTTDLAATEAALQTGTRWLLTAPLQQPYLTMPNLEALAELCGRYGCTLILEQTFTPLLASAGAALHHNLNMLTGQVQPTDMPTETPTDALAALCLPSGTLPQQATPPTAYPANGLETLALRLRAHSGHAQAAADVLAGHPGVRAVYHPGLSTHPQFEYAQQHCAYGYGGVLYAEMIAPHFASRLARRWKVGAQAIGGAHSALWADGRRQGLHGLWLGLEDIDDLLTELEEALE